MLVPAADRTPGAPLSRGALSFLEEGLEDLERRGLLRRLRAVRGPQDVEIELDGRRLLCFCSNDYLGLANDPRLIEASVAATRAAGCGSGASRLISGNLDEAEALERELARFKGVEAARVFTSGYHANTGAIPALVGPGDLLLSDELNHASLIDGARLSRAEVRVFRHRDLEHLDERLADGARYGRRLVVTDSVFSMDGALAPLDELLELARRHDALLYVDEAHATGVLGARGRGAVERFDLADERIVQMGTFGKALGSFGAYVAGTDALARWLANRARSFVFTTGLPPGVLAASRAALAVVAAEPERRARLADRVARLRAGLEQLGYRLGGDPEVPIVPVLVGEPGPTMELSRALEERGVLATGIRPPTVPPGTCRIRVTLMATMTDEHIDRALDAFAGARRASEDPGS